MSDNLNWSGTVTDVVPFGDQNLTIGYSTAPENPVGTVTIKGTGTPVLLLPNSTQAAPKWDDIPGTTPVLQARQDGHFPATDILIRYKDGWAARSSGTVSESLTTTVDRPTLVTPGTAADVWQYRYNGTRVTYVNEYACLRVRGIPDDQVPVRFMSHFSRDNTAHPIMQETLSDATTNWFQVLADGQILGPGGRSMLPSSALGVTFNGTMGNAATIADGASTGAPYALTTVLHSANNRVYLDGAAANNGGSSIAGGTLLLTVNAAHAPAAWVQFTVRTSTTLTAQITVRPDGTVRMNQAMAAGATVSLDGLNWRKA